MTVCEAAACRQAVAPSIGGAMKDRSSRPAAFDEMRDSAGGIRSQYQAFERCIGPVEQVQVEWHAHVQKLKAMLSGRDLESWKTGQVPGGTPVGRK